MVFFKIAATFYKMNPSWLNVTRNAIVIEVGDIFGDVFVMKNKLRMVVCSIAIPLAFICLLWFTGLD